MKLLQYLNLFLSVLILGVSYANYKEAKWAHEKLTEIRLNLEKRNERPVDNWVCDNGQYIYTQELQYDCIDTKTTLPSNSWVLNNQCRNIEQ